MIGEPRRGYAIFNHVAERILEGKIPYKDYSIEYPPFSNVIFLIPRLIYDNPLYYMLIWRGMIFTTVFAMVLIIKKLKGDWVLFLSAALIFHRQFWDAYDLFPSAMTLGAIALFYFSKKKSAYSLLAIGVLTKIFPIAVLPIFLWYDKERIKHGLLALTIIVFGFGIFFPLGGGDGIKRFFEYQGLRGTEIGSTRASLSIFKHYIFGTPVEVHYNHASYEVRESN